MDNIIFVYDVGHQNDMGVRISNTPQPVDRCRLYTLWYMEDGTQIFGRANVHLDRWNEHVNLWCPRSSLGRRACKRCGCRAKLSLLEEVEK